MRVRILFATMLIVSCGRSTAGKEEFKPVQDWHSGGPSHSSPGVGDPHAMPHGHDPHAGIPGAPSVGDPHAGVPGAPTISDPHAGGVDVEKMGLPAPDPNRSIDPTRFLRGTISLASSLKNRVRAGQVVFLSVRPIDANTGKVAGAPLAVEKYDTATLPIPFNITDKQAMIGGTRFAGDVEIRAWIDMDEDPMTKNPGDFIGAVKAKIPAANIKLEISTVRP